MHGCFEYNLDYGKYKLSAGLRKQQRVSEHVASRTYHAI
jgi:hypothetical protein